MIRFPPIILCFHECHKKTLQCVQVFFEFTTRIKFISCSILYIKTYLENTSSMSGKLSGSYPNKVQTFLLWWMQSHSVHISQKEKCSEIVRRKIICCSIVCKTNSWIHNPCACVNSCVWQINNANSFYRKPFVQQEESSRERVPVQIPLQIQFKTYNLRSAICEK